MIGAEHLAVMRDGAILANAGHFDVEIDVRALADLAVAVRRDLRPHVDSFELADGRRLLLLAEGRVVNLVAAEGHPAQAMDLSFGVQALALAWLAGHAGTLAADVHEVPAAHRRRGRPPGPGRDRRPDRRPHPGPVGLPGLLAHRLLMARGLPRAALEPRRMACNAEIVRMDMMWRAGSQPTEPTAPHGVTTGDGAARRSGWWHRLCRRLMPPPDAELILAQLNGQLAVLEGARTELEGRLGAGRLVVGEHG